MSTSSTETPTRTTPSQRPAPPSGAETPAGREVGASVVPAAVDRGRTSIESVVVRKIAGVATREVPGVHELGTSGKRAVGAVRQRIPGSSGPSVSQGVAVEVGQREAAVDLDVVVEFGAPITRVAGEIRANVVRSVERLTGLRVIEVNVSIDDVYVPSEDAGTSSRVE